MRRSARLASRTMSNRSTPSKGKQPVSNPTTEMRPPKWQYWVPPGDVCLKKARWDFENTKLFLDLLVDEVTTSRRGEAPMLTKEGYSNVSKKIYERTGIYLEQRQLKNKYDLLKKEWQAWSFLENPKYGVTGIGYDYSTGTWNASDEWWGMMIQMKPEVAKWRHEGIPHIDQMRAVFQGVTAKNHYVWTPAEMIPPFIQSRSHGTGVVDHVEVEVEGDNEEHIGRREFDFHTSPLPSSVPIGSPPPRRSPRLVGRTPIPPFAADQPVPPMSGVARNLFTPIESEGSSRGKKRSTPTEMLSGSISEVATQMGRNVKGAGIIEAVELMKRLPGVPEGSDLYWSGVEMIQNDRKRLTFLAMSSDEMRLNMVQKLGNKNKRPTTDESSNSG